MAIEKEIKLKVSDPDSVKVADNYEELAKSIDTTNVSATKIVDTFDKVDVSVKKSTKSLDELEKQTNDNTKATDNQKKSLSALNVVSGLVSKGFGAMGAGLKAIGFGLILAVVAKVTDAFSGNQKVSDALAVTLTAISEIVSKVIGNFIDMFGEVSKSTGGFDALRKVLGGALSLALNSVVITIQAIVLGVKEAQLAWEDSFLGNKDPKKIASLTADVEKVKKQIGETADRIKLSGKQIADNFGEAVSEVGELAQGIADAAVKSINEIDVAQAVSDAKRLEANKKNAELLELQRARLQLQYQAQAEVLRQLRDDDTKNIADRIKANDDLSKVLKKQAEVEAATIKARIATAQEEQKLTGITFERQKQIYQLQTDLVDVNERITGQQSEQLKNKNALLKEQITIDKTISDSEKQRQIAGMLFIESQTKDSKKVLELQRDRLKEELAVEEKGIIEKRAMYSEGTQARADAEQDFLNKKQDYDNQLIANDKATHDLIISQSLAYDNARSANDKLTFNMRLAANADALTQLNQQEFDSENAKTAALKANSDERIAILQAEHDQKVAIQNSELDLATTGAGILKQLAGKNKALAKTAIIIENAAAIAKIVVNTAAANAKAVAVSPLTGGMPFVAINTIAGGLGVVSSLLATKKALAEVGGGDAGGSAPAAAGGGGAPAPSFNIVGQNPNNQLADSIANKQVQPVQAFVVSGNVSTAQALDRGKIETATFNGG